MKKIKEEVWDYVGDPENLEVIKVAVRSVRRKGEFDCEDFEHEVIILIGEQFSRKEDKFKIAQSNKGFLYTVAYDFADYLLKKKIKKDNKAKDYIDKIAASYDIEEVVAI